MGMILRFEMPCRKNWPNIILYAIFVVLFAYLVFYFIRDEGSNIMEAFSAPFLILSSLLQLFIFIDVLIEGAWQLTGREVAEINNDFIALRHQIFGVGFTKKYYADKLDGVFVTYKEIRWHYYLTSRKASSFHLFRLGNIALNHGKTLFGGVKSAHFGSILEEGEARQIVGMILQRFPQYKPKAEVEFKGVEGKTRV
jgi:hypothetical protein